MSSIEILLKNRKNGIPIYLGITLLEILDASVHQQFGIDDLAVKGVYSVRLNLCAISAWAADAQAIISKAISRYAPRKIGRNSGSSLA